MKDVYKDGLYRSCYEVQKGLNIGKLITKVDDVALEKILSKPWTTDNMTFSDRIWKSKNQLIEEVQNEMTRMFTLGKSSDEAIKNISKKFNVSKSQASRLIQTEQAYFNALSDLDMYNRLGTEQIEILETLDSKTCSTCGDLDGGVIDTKDAKLGVNIPPFHPNCRGTTVPYFEDEDGERIARGEDGKQYYVPSTMKYNEWKEKFLIDNKYSSGNGLIGASSLSEIIKETKSIISQTFQDRVKGVKIVKTEDNYSKYSSVEDKIYLGDNTNTYDLIHELGHKLQQVFTKEERELYNKLVKAKFSVYKKKDFEYIKSNSDNENKGYFLLKNYSKFVHKYQSRIYENEKSFVFNNANYRYALEYFSVGIEFYYKSPILLQEKDIELYKFIEMVVKEK